MKGGITSATMPLNLPDVTELAGILFEEDSEPAAWIITGRNQIDCCSAEVRLKLARKSFVFDGSPAA
jgi:hypothetical protein